MNLCNALMVIITVIAIAVMAFRCFVKRKDRRGNYDTNS